MTMHIPDQTGRTVIVTGGSSGIGKATAAALAAKGARVILAVRDQTRGRAAAAEIGGLTESRPSTSDRWPPYASSPARPTAPSTT